MNIPSGNVTFLFTDIEGSTKLAQDFPDTLQSALEKHNSVLHKAIESNNGFVFEIVGDAFCCAFENADDAVKAAVDAQINLANEKWEDAVIKIRIGIHSGNAEWYGKRYMGYITLARTARIMSSGYGEQIIISDDTYQLTKDKFYAAKEKDISFRDLGERRMKDVIQPIRLFQILCPGLRKEFPSLKTLDARPNNLPIQLTSFIGREEEMKQVKDLLKQTHLLTLTGSGGAGKTRFAMQIAADVIDEFANGVWFIELAPLSEPALLPEAIMKVFGLKEEPKISLEETLCDYIKDKEMLIILDNCEHLVEQCATLTEKLLSNCPGLKIIATSREELRCSGERTHRIQSLEMPNPKEEISLEELYQYEAVILFIERALAVNANFRVNNDNVMGLAEICYRLDGIPLAIELAASRIMVLSIEKINKRLDDRFKLLTGGKRTAMPRQQTLRAMIDWSYDLLSEQEKILWRRLSVFAGGWTMEAAEVICSDEEIREEEVLNLLTNLTEKSIIIFDDEKERYRMLETIRQYGDDKLTETGDPKVISMNHLKYYMKFAESAEAKLIGSEMQTWLEKLDEDNGNLEKALLWSSEKGDNEEGMKLAGALGYYWKIRGHLSAGSRWVENVLFNSPEAINSARGKALCIAGIFARLQGEYEKANKLCENSLAIHRKIGDKRGIANSLESLGQVAIMQGQYGRARVFYEESLSISSKIKDKSCIASSLNSLGNMTFKQGEYDCAWEFYEKSLSISREIGDKRSIAMSLNHLGNVTFNRGMHERARKLHEESLVIKREIGDKRGIAASLLNLGSTAFKLGEYERARKFYEESLTICREIGDKHRIAMSLNNLGDVAFNQGEYEWARRFSEKGLSMYREIGHKDGIASSLNSLGNVALDQKEYDQAIKLFEESLILNREFGNKKQIVNNILGFAEIHVARGKHNEAAILLGFIDEMLQSMKAVLERQEKIYYERTISLIRKQLSEEKFSKYRLEGNAMTLEQAAELALSNVL